MSSDDVRIPALMRGMVDILEVIEHQSKLADAMVEKIKEMDKKLKLRSLETKMNSILITMLAKHSGIREGTFMEMADKAGDLALVLPDFLKEMDDASKEEVDEIIKKFKETAQ